MTIRGRLSLWYSLVVFVALVTAGTLVLFLQARLGLARVDAELADAAATVAGVLRNELQEGQDLSTAVRDMVSELVLAGEGFAVISPADTVVDASAIDGVQLPDRVLVAAAATPATMDAGPARIRIRAVTAAARASDVRVVTWKALGPLEIERRTLGRALLIGIPIAVCVSILGGLTIGRRALRPLTVMAGQAGAIRSSDLDARLSVTDVSDELGMVGLAFNGLLERLAAARRQQRTFMADASHQLRTPVSVIRTTAQVMLSRAPRSEHDYRDALDVVARQAERLTKLVNDMFTLAMADAQARPLQLASFYLDEMITEVAAEVAVLAAAKHVALDAAAVIETPCVGDEFLLRQLLANLLENAIRHTPPHGTVTVNLTRSSSGILVSVADTGPGITAADTERVFERFVRLGSSGTDAGGGLGLPIARWIAEAHGGHLVLADTGPAGSRFEVRLPPPRGLSA